MQSKLEISEKTRERLQDQVNSMRIELDRATGQAGINMDEEDDQHQKSKKTTDNSNNNNNNNNNNTHLDDNDDEKSLLKQKSLKSSKINEVPELPDKITNRVSEQTIVQQ